MTEATAAQKTDFHPQLEEIFDEAQVAPVLTTPNGKEIVVMSVSAFETAIANASMKADEVLHQRVDRGAKPGVVLIKRQTFDNLAAITNFFKSPEAEAQPDA